MDRSALPAVALVLLSAVAGTASAQVWDIEWTFFSDPDPTGPLFDTAPGPDFFFGTGDEVNVPGDNPSGHASYSAFNLPGFTSYEGGTFTSLFDFNTGRTLFTGQDVSGTVVCAAGVCGPNKVVFPFQTILSYWPGPAPTASSNSGQSFADQTFTYEFDVRSLNDPANLDDDEIVRVSGGGWFLQAGQDPGALPSGIAFAPEVVSHFQAVLGSDALPADWVTLSVFHQTFETLAGPNVGVSGNQTATAFFGQSDFNDGPGSRAAGQIFDEGTTFIRTLVGDTTDGGLYYYNGVNETLDNAYVGREATGTGILSLLGASNLHFQGGIVGSVNNNNIAESVSYVGLRGSGRMHILEGSTVTGIRFLGVGELPGANGELLVDGPGSALTLAGFVAEDYANQFGRTGGEGSQGGLSIGAGGVGRARVSNGGLLEVLEITGQLNRGLGIVLGGGDRINGGGDGVLEVDGVGSLVRIVGSRGGLGIGGAGDDVNNPGNPVRGTGQVSVTGGGRVELINDAPFPAPGDPMLLTVGAGGTGSLDIDGPGSTVSVSGNSAAVWVGGNNVPLGPIGGTGVVNVTSGGRLEVDASATSFLSNYVVVGPLAGTTGTVIVDGADSELSAPYVSIASNATLNEFGQDPLDQLPDIAPGTGTLIVSNGGHVDTSFGIFVGDGGTLGGNGSVSGGVFTAPGSTVAPGLSPGDLAVEGMFDMSGGGTLELEIDDLTTFDRVLADGFSFSAATTIALLFADGVDPNGLEGLGIGDFLRIGDAGSNTAADPLSDLPGLDLVNFVGQSNTHPIVDLGFDIAGGFQVTAVPLPPAAWLLAGALALLRAGRKPLIERKVRG